MIWANLTKLLFLVFPGNLINSCSAHKPCRNPGLGPRTAPGPGPGRGPQAPGPSLGPRPPTPGPGPGPRALTPFEFIHFARNRISGYDVGSSEVRTRRPCGIKIDLKGSLGPGPRPPGAGARGSPMSRGLLPKPVRAAGRDASVAGPCRILRHPALFPFGFVAAYT